MNIKRKALLFLLTGTMLITSGCGATVKELTAEEEEIISLYAAKVVAKHNVRLSQGIVRYKASTETEEVTEEESEEETTEEEAKVATDESTTDASDETTEASTEENTSSVSLTEAFAIDGIEFTYQGADIYNDLQGSNSYIEEPSQGNKYVGISFKATNTSGSDIDLSILTMNTKFTAKLGSESESAKSMAMLLNDLPTYTGTIKSGDSKELSVYFEFPEDATKDLSSLTLTAEINGKSSRIKLI